MCFNWQNIQQSEEREELTLAEIEKISRNFRPLMELNLSGGEPFLRDDLVEILQLFYKNSDTRLFTIPTNSSCPDRIIEFVRKMVSLMPSAWFRITLSLSHLDEKNDEIRGRAGSFQETIETSKRLHDLKRRFPQLSTGCSAVLTKFNKDDIYDVFDYIDLNVPCDSYGFLNVRGDPMDKDASDVAPEDSRRLVEYLTKKRQGKFKNSSFYSKLFSAVGRVIENNVLETILEDKEVVPCLAGKRMVVISDTGDVMPCELMDGAIPKNSGMNPVFGNLRDYDYDIKKLLELPNTKKVLQYIKNSRCHCSFECAMTVSTVFNPRWYPKIIKNIFKNL